MCSSAVKLDLEPTRRVGEELRARVHKCTGIIARGAPVEGCLVVGDVAYGGGFANVSIRHEGADALVAFDL
jgi:hypothetical protein